MPVYIRKVERVRGGVCRASEQSRCYSACGERNFEPDAIAPAAASFSMTDTRTTPSCLYRPRRVASLAGDAH